MSKPQTLIDFTAEPGPEWFLVNDGVMGGRSRSNLRRTDRKTGLFTGILSLDNGGGFASARTVLGPTDLSGALGLELRVRGDGRTYQLRLRTDDGFDGVAYRALFDTPKETWVNITLSFERFLPSFRGRILENEPALDPAAIRQVALMVADGVAGPFSLELDYLRSWKPKPG